jgi:hypothetical protein
MFTLAATILVAGCAGIALGPAVGYVAPTASGKPPNEVSKLVAASEERLFPCSILRIQDAADRDAPDLAGFPKADVTLLPGAYRVTLRCASAQHSWEPSVRLLAKAGKSYRVTGKLIDDSITIFNMKMRATATELP